MKTRNKIALILVMAFVLAYVIGAFYFHYHFYPGSTSNHVNIGGLTASAAQDKLDESLSEYKLTINGTDTEDTISASDIDLSYVYEDDTEGNYLKTALNKQNIFLWPYVLISKQNGEDVSLVPEFNSDKLGTVVENLNCVSPSEIIEPQDAYLSYEDGKYTVVEDVPRNSADAEKVYSHVELAIETLGEEILCDNISVEDCYQQAEITADDEGLIAQAEAANKILASNITVTTAYHTATLDADTIKDFLVFNEDDTVEIDRDLVYEWVNSNISGPNYTIGKERTISTPSSGEVTVSGGTYGIWVNVSEETDQVMSELAEGKTVEREPSSYRVSEISTENDGVGYTFIDVDISDQMVYLVEDNEVTYSTPCVTGLANGKRDTPTGTYYVSWKTTNWTMKTYDSFVYYWMPIDDNTGVGLHDATWRSSFGGSIYKTNGSHGCINLPKDAAKYLYNNTEVGIPVIVHN